ncbi:MAG: polysaccharide pyruvyl transferase family protein, partial [Candidatus Peribacteraceae bacterium]|nr:polysaccharide pyruvyl transferase family protein [Candidatus Peribacteraceae bacterium]
MRIGYCYANRKNIGDHLSYLGIRGLLGLQGEEIFFDTPYMLLATSQRKVERSDVLIIGGGGLFHAYFRQSWERILESGKPYVLFGIGNCEVKEQDTVLPMGLRKQIVERAAIVSFRDERSAEPFRSMPHVRVAPCPSIN